MTGEQVRWGFENLNLSAGRPKQLGFENELQTSAVSTEVNRRASKACAPMPARGTRWFAGRRKAAAMDVREASHAFTGWSCETRIPRLPYGRFPWKFEYTPEDHEDGATTFRNSMRPESEHKLQNSLQNHRTKISEALERAKGIEPSTYSLGSCRSTTELRPRSEGQPRSRRITRMRDGEKQAPMRFSVMRAVVPPSPTGTLPDSNSYRRTCLPGGSTR